MTPLNQRRDKADKSVEFTHHIQSCIREQRHSWTSIGVNPRSSQEKRRVWPRYTAYALFVMLSCVFASAHAQSFALNARAARFVSAVVMDDFHTAQSGGGYLFSYDAHETDATLKMKLARWFSGADPDAIRMAPAEKRTLFGFYWAASMMSEKSACFDSIAQAACSEELGAWMAREAADDPRFVRAYESAVKSLGLPPYASPLQ
ncbi:hypothetical protein [Caballeronia sp. BCC1704]|uniref:hypothetical protein n=1 Tax=Caballeronia sp. BCC1704 TaxID=2676300 RepID=UPI001FC84C08|nr:hypothetical protein [Caballeronia sp. BCC1704]